MRSAITFLYDYKSKLAAAAVLVIILGAIGSVLWPGSNSPGNPANSGPLEKLTVGTVGDYSSLIFIAEERGYFRDNGLDVTTVDYESGPPGMADLLAGKVDMTTAADFVGVRNSFAGEDLRILAQMASADSFFLVVRADHNISRPGDLRGKKVGITGKTAGEFYLGQYLTFNQMQLSEITTVSQPPTTLADLFIKGDIDAMVSFDPHVYKVESELGGNAAVWHVQNGQRLHTNLFGTGKLTRERPEAIRKFIGALILAEEYIGSNNNEARGILARRLNYEPAYAERIWPRLEWSVSLDQELLIDMDDQARWAIENQLTATTRAPNYLRLIYFDGLEAVRSERITIIR